MSKLLLAHDLGTSGNKATLFSTDGKLIKSLVIPYPTHFFNSNWSEQNPDDWWKAVCESTKQLLQDINPDDVLAMSFSGQMMGCLCVDKNGVPLRNAIIWADQRSEDQANFIRQKIDDHHFYRITGHRISSSYSLEKLLWIKDHEPDIYGKTYKVLNAKDYIVYKLTGQFMTDYSDASSTNAFDLNTFTWSDEIIHASGIDADLLPDVKPSTFVVDQLSSTIAKELGLSSKTAVVLGAGDGVCSAVGAGSIEEGKSYSYLGSSAWIAVTSKQPFYDEEMRTFNWAHAVPGYVTPCGTMQAAGNSYSWLKNEICYHEKDLAKQSNKSAYGLMNDLIASSSIGSNGLIFLPYLLGERSPRWNPKSKGSFIGVKMEHKRADFIRSVIEGIFFNMDIILKILQNHVSFQELTVIGGLAQGAIQRKIMADIYGLDIFKLKHLEEATSMGAAVIAGVGVGSFKDFHSINRFIDIENVQKPDPANVKEYNLIKPVFDECYQQLVDIFPKL
ncbi:xylulokinase [Vallitalea okinawensis]|uniref:xylulokinase n=1 Tax=Vallitalea okinawensis TaxID=2078660 RepID=UPI000CFB6A0A|nr:xylulokinase [Vallitalea okinawensis]